MKVAELRAALHARGLPTAGKKADLENRLREDDEKARNAIFSTFGEVDPDDDGVVVVKTPKSQLRHRIPDADTPHKTIPKKTIESNYQYPKYLTSVIYFTLACIIIDTVFPATLKWPDSYMLIADIIDISTVPIIITAYWFLLRGSGTSTVIPVLFVELAGLWATGHGIQLAGSHFARQIDLDPAMDTFNGVTVYGWPLGILLRHGSACLLHCLITIVQAQHPFEDNEVPSGGVHAIVTLLLVLFGAVHGVQIFIVNKATPLVIPLQTVAVIATIFIKVVPSGIVFRRVPIVVFMTIAVFTSTLLATVWAIFF